MRKKPGSQDKGSNRGGAEGQDMRKKPGSQDKGSNHGWGGVGWGSRMPAASRRERRFERICVKKYARSRARGAPRKQLNKNPSSERAFGKKAWRGQY
jgi:hypothetical protein